MAFFSKISSLFTRKITAQARAIAVNFQAELMADDAEDIKQDILDEVRNHPISQEIANITMPSQFISSNSGSATLYGFLGFEAGREPIEELIDFLDEKIQVKKSVKSKFLFFGKKTVSSLTLPSKKDMSTDSRCKVEWSSQVAWPVLVENGLSGLFGASHFLQLDSEHSRSGLGLQVKKPVRPDMAPTPFLSEIFKKFKDQLA